MSYTAIRLLSAAILFLGTTNGGWAAQSEASRLLAESGVKGGLVVHLGCGDGKLTAALRANDSYLVQGLDADAGKVAAAREWIQSLGLYGKVTAEPWTGSRLPYADNLVNLLVCEQPGGVSQEEISRVLAPGGVAYVKEAGDWHKTSKPWPQEIDEWTHHLHDAGGNAVARDRVVGPPSHVQWTADPRWSRSHGWSPSVSAMVSAAGRVFWICDETIRGIDDTVPDQWFLSARDAFSGVLLWKRPVPHWGSRELSGTPGTGARSTNGRFSMPPQLAKRLVAVGDTVYVTLGAAAPVTALDAATGEERRTHAATAGADEILCTGGRLIVALNPAEKPELPAADETHPPAPAPGKRICVVDAQSGKVLWNKGPFTAIRATRTQDPFGRVELAVGDGLVFLLTDQAIEALSIDDGSTAWRIARPALPAGADRRLGFAGMYDFLLSVLVHQDGVVLLAQPEPNAPHTTHSMPGTLYAFDAHDGHPLWKHAFGTWGHCTQPDVYVIDGLVWTYLDAGGKLDIRDNGWASLKDRSGADYRAVGLDLRTGQVRRELSTKDIFDVGHHHRCFRNMITERFLMTSRRGVEFVDLTTGENYQNHWVRSGCLLGDLPCNGLLYVAPHACACYINAKLTGFNALAPSRKDERPGTGGADLQTPALERGPAYASAANPQSLLPNPADWPTYRHDAQRSGAAESAVAPKLKISWKASLGARPSGLVVADGRVFAAGVDAHAVYALGAADGRRLWSYTAEARVDSPPTVYQGLAAFGSADGRVYALRASDGALVWRFRAAPQETRVTVRDQLESPWPVPGNVLAHEGKCWFAAGRSSYLDGGIHLFALDFATGKVAHEQTIYSADPKTGKMPLETEGMAMAGLLNDIPAAVGPNVFIRQMCVTSTDGRQEGHLFSSAGYLDPSWFNRTAWGIGEAKTSGLMVLGKDVAYGVEVYGSNFRETAFHAGGGNAVFTPGASVYRLVCFSLKEAASEPSAKRSRPKAKNGLRPPAWQQPLGIRVTAMVRAGKVIFVAGSPDIVDPQDPHGAWEGRKGGMLAALSAADGKTLAVIKLPSPPVWDGMAAARGKLYVGLEEGAVACLSAAEE
jgi:outer membrane protein assembly factor BamB